VNLLYLAHRIPYPPDKGDKIRSFHQVRHLAARHRVALVCFVDDRADLPHADTLRELCSSVEVAYRSPRGARIAGLRGLADGRAISVAAFDSASLRRAAAARLPQADVVVAFSSVMAQYVPSDAAVPRLVDFVDADSDKWKLYAARRRGPAAWIYAREGNRLARFEDDVARTWDHSLFVSERDARILRVRVPGSPVSVLPNGVDLEFFNRSAAGTDPGYIRPGTPAPHASQLVFTGVMDYFPNVDGVRHFCDSIFPRVRAAIPDATFTIVGRNPSRAVRSLARLKGVVVTGSVPDVRPFLAAADIAVAPLRVARGLQNKVLEAMAMRLPVVGSSTAFEGIDTMEGAGVETADDPREFADRVIALLRDPVRRAEAGRRARSYVERHHRWADHGAALEALLVRLVEAGRGTPPTGRR
jgi:sugar transferase (PEP-CTERM/EpsH1 system associated)